MPDAINGQTDFGAGIYRGREAPENAVYDAVNFLVDDEGQLFRRGGSAYRSTANAGTALLGLADAYTGGGRRTIMWGPAGPDMYVLDAGNAPQAVPRYSDGGGALPADNPLLPNARAVAAGGFLILPATYAAASLNVGAFLYAGSLKTVRYSGYSMAVTAGSATVTGTGTAFVANVDAGMIFRMGGFSDPAGSGREVVIPVASVQSNTSLTLTQASPVTASFATCGLYPKMPIGLAPPFGSRFYFAAAANRVIMAAGTRAYFSDPFTIFSLSAAAAWPLPTGWPDQYHELPADAVIFGADSIRDTAILFTATGVWAISQLLFDPIDDMGNIQHQVEQINKDLVLWGDSGISSYAGALVVPGLEDIVLMDATGGMQVISQAIRAQYRAYVKAGYRPGVAVVHRGHYYLPVLRADDTLADVLVCRVDRGTAWTRWSGHAASTSYAQRVGEPSRAPLLLGIAGQRVTDLSSCHDPSPANPSEADGTTHPVTVETRDYATPGRRIGSTTETLRLRYEASTVATPPSLTAEYSRYAPGVSATPVTTLAPVAAVATSNVSLGSPPGSIGGVTLTTGMRVLLNGQASPAQNGVYWQNPGPGLGRTPDADTWAELVGASTVILGGAFIGWVAVSDAAAGGTLGTTPVAWAISAPPTPSYTALGLLTGGAASDGSSESVWRVGKRAPAIRFRISSVSALTLLRLRSLEAPWRRST